MTRLLKGISSYSHKLDRDNSCKIHWLVYNYLVN